MSQVTSPIILDSTGQDIVTQLATISAALAAGKVVTGNTDTTLSGVLQGANGKVAVKPVDASPTADSTNLVSSGGTDKAIKGRVPVYGMGKNLLENWYLVGGGSQQGAGNFPINQRGQTSYSGTGYGIDRWKQINSNIQQVVQSDCLRMNAVAAVSGNVIYCYFYCPKLPAGTYTLSILVKEATGSGVWYVSSNSSTGYPIGNVRLNAGIVTKTFTATGNETNQFFYLWHQGALAVGDYLDIIAAKLECGSEQTLCHNEGTAEAPVWVLNEIPDYGEELRKCQRYYFSYQVPANQVVAFPGIRVDLTAGTNIGVQLDLPVVMAKSPIIDGVAHSIRGNGSNWNTGLSVTSTAIGMYANHIAVEVIASNASFPRLTSGYAVLFSKLNLSAEP